MYFFTYCPDCGAALPRPEGRAERLVVQVCPTCRAEHFRNAKPCAGALVVREGKVLLAKRAIEPERGKWDIPGGFLNAWETPAQCAAREVLEETGLSVRLGDVVAIEIDNYGEQYYTLNVYYLAEPTNDQEPTPADDVDELRWFAADELPASMAFAHTKAVLASWAQTTHHGAVAGVQDVDVGRIGDQ